MICDTDDPPAGTRVVMSIFRTAYLLLLPSIIVLLLQLVVSTRSQFPRRVSLVNPILY